jgi:hypothetical protein
MTGKLNVYRSQGYTPVRPTHRQFIVLLHDFTFGQLIPAIAPALSLESHCVNNTYLVTRTVLSGPATMVKPTFFRA